MKEGRKFLLSYGTKSPVLINESKFLLNSQGVLLLGAQILKFFFFGRVLLGAVVVVLLQHFPERGGSTRILVGKNTEIWHCR